MESSVEAVRLALSIEEMRSRMASKNIAQSSNPNARAIRVAFPEAEFLLRMLSTSPRKIDDIDIRKVEARVRSVTGTASNEPILADREIGDMVSANMSYQTLTEALSRKFGLMRLAITGRN